MPPGMKLLELGSSDVHQPAASTKKKAKKNAPLLPKKRPGRKLHVRADLAPGSSLHVRHMADRVQLEGQPVALDDGEAKPIWIQIAKPGVFKGHHAGPFELNDKVFAEIVKNFHATQNKSIPIDFEHASEADSSEGSIPSHGAPAQGWIRDLKIQGGNLWGLVEWGSRAREYIRAGQYKFFSPAIRFGARDRVTGASIGARMTSGALTNNPFLDGMKPVAAKDGTSEGCTTIPNVPLLEGGATTMSLAHAPSEYMPSIRYALRVSDLATAAECSSQLDRLREHFDAAGGDANASNEGINLSDFLYPLRNIVGARLGDTWDEVFDAVSELIEAAMGVTSDDDDVEMNDNQPDEGPTQEEGGPTADEGTNAMFKDLNEAVAKFSDLQTKSAEQQLKLKDEQARAEKAEAELAKLRDESEKRKAKDIEERVELAFETYKDSRKLTDGDKEAMLIVLTHKPETFEKQYPKVKAGEQHLLRNITDHRETSIPKDAEGGGEKVLNMADAARVLARQKRIPLDQAQRIVMRANPPKKIAR